MKNAASGKFHIHTVIKIVLFLPTNLHFNIDSIHKSRMLFLSTYRIGPLIRVDFKDSLQFLSTLDITVVIHASNHCRCNVFFSTSEVQMSRFWEPNGCLALIDSGDTKEVIARSRRKKMLYFARRLKTQLKAT